MVKDPQSGLKEKQYPTILKEDFPSRINPSLVYRKSNEINLVLPALKFKKALPNPSHSVAKIRFECESSLKLLSQKAAIVRVERSITNISRYITDNNIQKIVNTQQEKWKVKNAASSSTSIDSTLMRACFPELHECVYVVSIRCYSFEKDETRLSARSEEPKDLSL